MVKPYNDLGEPQGSFDFGETMREMAETLQGPFARQPIVQAKITLEELFEMLRRHVGKSYMPSSHRNNCPSRPDSLQAGDVQGFVEKAGWWSDLPSYYRFNKADGFSSEDQPEMYAALPLGDLAIVVDLHNLRGWVCEFKALDGKAWNWPEETGLAIDRIELARVLSLL